MDPIWNDIFSREEWGRYPPEHVIRFVARHFYRAPDRKAVRILDLGSGPGACTWYLAREGFTVSAIDGSATAIQRLRARLDHEAPGTLWEARVGDVCAPLPWPDATFDAVVDNGCLCCNPASEIRRAVGEIARILKPGGLLYSVAFDPETAGFATGTQVAPLCYTGMQWGVLAGRGTVQFADPDLLPYLYEGLRMEHRQRLEWDTPDCEPVRQWLVTLRKAEAQEAAA